MKLKTI